ncbi:MULTISPECIES: response regulator [Streptomycetaceae]|uniref:response regulator n=1 Tax=Streptomycetaceae TaxID=2062 RepID=UPI00093D9E86|nr:response regulator transcription factor [Streptomyces sp. CB02056]OKI06798.1 LuxR family transcriptional regulator [Streptomyces sp. CB02056]
MTAAGERPAPPVRVVVADDQALVRAGLAGIVAAADGFTVVGEAADGAQAVRLARTEHPDVALMDIRMPGTDGLAATRRITAESGVRILVLTTFDLDEYIYGALRAGASGFLLKSTPPEDLLTAIRVVAAGEALLAPSVTRRLIRAFTAASTGPAEPPADRDGERQRVLQAVTGRELEVLTLIGRGLTNTEIAERLCVSTGTVKTHVGHLLAKLAARDRVHLVITAYRAALVA